jgi:hypothetical protein
MMARATLGSARQSESLIDLIHDIGSASCLSFRVTANLCDVVKRVGGNRSVARA